MAQFASRCSFSEPPCSDEASILALRYEPLCLLITSCTLRNIERYHTDANRNSSCSSTTDCGIAFSADRHRPRTSASITLWRLIVTSGLSRNRAKWSARVSYYTARGSPLEWALLRQHTGSHSFCATASFVLPHEFAVRACRSRILGDADRQGDRCVFAVCNTAFGRSFCPRRVRRCLRCNSSISHIFRHYCCDWLYLRRYRPGCLLRVWSQRLGSVNRIKPADGNNSTEVDGRGQVIPDHRCPGTSPPGA